jgi:hypothetical protein
MDNLYEFTAMDAMDRRSLPENSKPHLHLRPIRHTQSELVSRSTLSFSVTLIKAQVQAFCGFAFSVNRYGAAIRYIRIIPQDDSEFNDFDMPERQFFGDYKVVRRAVLLETACSFHHCLLVDEYNGESSNNTANFLELVLLGSVNCV